MVLIECPFCNQAFEAEMPDKLHSAFSLVNPIPHSYYGKILKTTHKCPNPNCQKTVTVKWYNPQDYFARI